MTERSSRCRGCGVQVKWVRMESGKWNPLNPQPDPERGNVVIDDQDRGHALGPDTARVVRDTGEALYLSHFASCPKRGTFRKADRVRESDEG